MCCVIRYWFTCQHGFRTRRSKCGGTKHKKTRSGLLPACKSEAYLSIITPVKCGPCQYLAFEKYWKRKLFVAELFLEKLREKSLPGLQEVASMIEQLKDEFNTATWNTRTRFPHIHKEHITRVVLGHFKKRPSPLRHEMSPEDVPEPSEVFHPNLEGYEYDWDYLASTDPLHPVDVNYAHPLDNVDPSWMLNHLSAEEFEQTSSGNGFDAGEAVSLWAKTSEQFQSDTIEWDENGEGWPRYTSTSESSRHHSRLSPGVHNRQAIATAQTKESNEQNRVEMVVQEFSRLLNNNDSCDELPERSKSVPNKRPSKSLRQKHISDASSKQNAPQECLITSPLTPGQLSDDGAGDSQLPILPLLNEQRSWSLSATLAQIIELEATDLNHTPQTAETSAPNSTYTTYDKLRQHASKTKNVDKVKFYEEWLCLSRCKIKDVEGMNGRLVQDPQLPQKADAKNGWWR